MEKKMENEMENEMETAIHIYVYVHTYEGCPIFFLPKSTLSPPFRGPFAGFRPQHFLKLRNKPYPNPIQMSCI